MIGKAWFVSHSSAYRYSEGAETIHPLFVVFDQTPERIKKGLKGACLPMVVQSYRPALIDDCLELVDQD